MNEPNHNTERRSFQTHPVGDRFIKAEQLLTAAIQCIEEGCSGSTFGAVKTCAFLVDLLEGARLPLRRLGGVQ